jgi:septal ring factor EnvC (AmiA/AmiB activator)
MNQEKELEANLKVANDEIEKYKRMAAEYELKLNKVILEYERVNAEIIKARESMDEINKDMEETVASYNCIKKEYEALEMEFVNMVELAVKNPKECIEILVDYAKNMGIIRGQNNGKKQKDEKIKFRIIEGGKIN